MSDKTLQIRDPEILEGVKQLPPELTQGGPMKAIAYAQQLMQDAVPAELYVAPGVLHGGGRVAPNAKIAQTAHYLMADAVKRIFKL